MARWRVACDVCAAFGWIGERPPTTIVDAWCEGCQSAHALTDRSSQASRCPRCDGELTLGEPRFEELLGDAQNLAAVLHAWCGDPGPLATLLPDRPRLLTDLEPPRALAGDPREARQGLEALARSQFGRARTSLLLAVRAPGARSHLWRGLGVAAQRLGDLPAAEEAFTHALEALPHDTTARLNRGALRARRGDYAAARADFALAGDRHEARWDRAALLVIEAVATSRGSPAAEVLVRARMEAGEPSSYWSDHTVGRLLWALLVERALAAGGAPAGEGETVMRAAERELEFRTFWDRALVVHGYAVLGMKAQAGDAAAAIASELLGRLAAEPFARGPAGAWLAAPLAAATTAVAERRPGDALAAVRSVMERPEVGRYRVPCATCGKGSLGVESFEDAGPGR
jgi:tetratricopeptide (TPR) repeat protein